jgi:uncharacterized protein (DUF58 family)
MDWGIPNKLAYARALAAAVGYIALGRNDMVSVSGLGRTTRTLARVRGRGRALDVFKFVDGLRSEGRMDLDQSLTRLAFRQVSGGRTGGQVVLFSDLLVPLETFSRGLEFLLANRLDVVVVHLLSPAELEPQPGGDFGFVDSETGRQVRVALTVNAITRYMRRLEEWQEDVAAACAQHGVRYLRARTDELLEDVVLRRLRERMILS